MMKMIGAPVAKGWPRWARVCVGMLAGLWAGAVAAQAPQAPRVTTIQLPPQAAASSRSAVAEVEAIRLGGGPLRVAYPREVGALATAPALAQQLRWDTTPEGGRVAAVALTSPQALGLRLGLVVDRLPANALLRFYAPGDTQVQHQVTGAEVLALLARNREAGDTTEAGRTYWGPLGWGDTWTVELLLPPGASAADMAVSLPRVAHFFLSADEMDGTVASTRAASCEIDMSCHTSTWAETANSVAKLSYIEGGYAYVCTGTLMADRAGSRTPYFLSAYHCVNNQTVASTVETRWFYRSASCNGSSTSPLATTVTGGAALLYASASTDTSFMRLNRAAPSGATFANWTSSLATNGSSITALHHPRGGLQKISFGQVAGYESCTADDSEGYYSCNDASSSTGNYLSVRWSSGITEGGSSGSGIWLKDGSGKPYLVGTLRGGTSSCGYNGTDTYGRFDLAYQAALSTWLGGASSTASASQVACLLNWAEAAYPTLFAPAGAANQVAEPYTYRHYPQTGNYLGVSSQDGHVYYLDPAGLMQDLGAASNWLGQAGC